jgi:hypothetical protein
MIIRKIVLIFAVFLLIQGVFAQQFKHGLILGGGGGNLNGVVFSFEKYPEYINEKSGTDIEYSDYKFNASFGYKFRIDNDKRPFFVDMDLNVGMKKYKYAYQHLMKDEESGYSMYSGFSGNINVLFTSLNVVFNYKIYKGLYAGAGVAPSLYFDSNNSVKYAPDLSLTAKAGYDLKFMGISFDYRYGLLNTLNDFFRKGRMNDWQVQLFIPF